MPNFHVKIRLIFFKDGYRATVKISLCICVVLSGETNSKSGKTYLIATIEYTWCAYSWPPLTGINHYNL